MSRALRLAHVADMHLGAGQSHGVLQPDGVNGRVTDFGTVWVEICEEAVRRRVDAFLFSGDGFRTCRPTPTEEIWFGRGLEILRRAEIPVLLLAGNHDLPGAIGDATALDIYQRTHAPGAGPVTVVRTPQTLTFVRPQDGEPLLQVACLPYFHRSFLAAAIEGLSLEETVERLERGAETVIRGLAAQIAPGVPAIAAVHHNIRGARTSTGWETASFSDPNVPLGPLVEGPWSYVAAGHIHKLQNLAPAGAVPVVYPGSPERVDFGEEHEPKGWCYVEIAGGRAEWEHVPTQARPFRTLRLDLTGAAADLFLAAADAETQILDSIRGANLSGAVVRIQYRAERHQLPAIRHEELARAVRDAGAYNLSGIEADVVDPERPAAVEGLSQDTDPAEALRRVIEADEQLRTDADALVAAFQSVYQEVTGHASRPTRAA